MFKSRSNPRVVFLGMRGPFSRIPLARLIAEGIAVQAVFVPADPQSRHASTALRRLTPEPSPSDVPLLTRFVEPNIVHLGWEHDLPVFEVSRLDDPATLATVAEYRPDVICVACFNQRFPPALLALPRYGCVNLHPSLLPAYRGPAPLFWVFRNGERETGVTLHLMDEGLDTGAILRQQRLAIPEGIHGAVLEEQCASLGAGLMVEAVRSLAAGTASPTPQDPEKSSYYPWPQSEDFRISTTQPARWAFNFIRGVAYLDGPLSIQTGRERFFIRDAVSYTLDAQLSEPFIRRETDLWVQCTPGVLHVELRAV